MEDWKDSFAEVWKMALRKGLDQGLRPHDMNLSLEGVLHDSSEATVDELANQLNTRLELS